MTNHPNRNWSYKVTKSQRGSDGTPRRAPSRKPATPRVRRRDPAPGETFIYRASHGRDDRGYETGEVVRLGDRYMIVVEPQGKWRVGQEDDVHEGEWRCGAIAREATETESLARRERDAKAAQKKAASAELRSAIAAMPSQGRGACLPAWTTRENLRWSRRISDFSSEDLYVTPDGAASYYPMYDDDPVIRVALAGSPEYDRLVAALAAHRTLKTQLL